MSIDQKTEFCDAIKNILSIVSVNEWTDATTILNQFTDKALYNKALTALVGKGLLEVQTTLYSKSIHPSDLGLYELVEWTGNGNKLREALKKRRVEQKKLDPGYIRNFEGVSSTGNAVTNSVKLLLEGQQLKAKIAVGVIPKQFILELQDDPDALCTILDYEIWREESANQNFEDTPVLARVNTGKKNKPTIPLEIYGEKATIEPVDELLEITHPDKHYEKIGAVIEEKNATIVEAIRENTAAINNNTRNQEKAAFNGTFRAQARFQEPIDEVAIEKVHRLRQDNVEWNYIGRTIYHEENGNDIAETDLPGYVNSLQQKYKRAYPDPTKK